MKKKALTVKSELDISIYVLVNFLNKKSIPVPVPVNAITLVATYLICLTETLSAF